MKKYFALVFVALLLVACTACSDEKDPEETTTTTANTTTSTTAKADDTPESITAEKLNTMPESPVEDFFLSDDGTGNLILQQYEGDETILVIPNEKDGKKVVKNNQYIFANKKQVVAIKFPEHLTEIELSSCAVNPYIQVVVLGKGTKTIGVAAFQMCTALREVQLNEGLETIQKFAFSQCDNLKSITIPASVTDISKNAFYGCVDNFIIYGEAGSAAETFAQSQGIEFRVK